MWEGMIYGRAHGKIGSTRASKNKIITPPETTRGRGQGRSEHERSEEGMIMMIEWRNLAIRVGSFATQEAITPGVGGETGKVNGQDVNGNGSRAEWESVWKFSEL
jgi:hypothetical protein